MRKTLISSRENRPLTMTSAKGRCESVPTPVASAAGNNPSAATSAVIMIGRSRRDRALARRFGDARAVAAAIR